MWFLLIPSWRAYSICFSSFGLFVLDSICDLKDVI